MLWVNSTSIEWYSVFSPLSSFKLLITECTVCGRPTVKEQSAKDPRKGNYRKFSSTTTP